MDILFIVLVVLAFVITMLLNLSVTWILLITVLAAVCYLSFRYPDGRGSWKFDTRQTLYMLLTIVSLCILGALMYKVSESVLFPNTLTLVLAGSAVMIAILVVASLLAPEGKRRTETR